MSANIYWEQVKPHKGKSVSTFTPSALIESLKNAFGTFPVRLSEKDVPVLRGMAAIKHEEKNRPYDELIEAIATYGTIKVWAEY